MNNAGNHNTPWSDTDIRKYLQGELSAREMHELEKAALDDPFLSDALEGLAAAPSPDADVDQLRSRLNARVEKKDGARVIWWRRPAYRLAAASVLFVGLGLTAFLTYFTSGKSRLNVDIERAPATVKSTPQTPVQSSAATADSTRVAMDSAAASSYAVNEKQPVNQKRALPVAREQEPASHLSRRASSPERAKVADTGALKPVTARIAPPPATSVARDEQADGYLAITKPTYDSLHYDFDDAKGLKKQNFKNTPPLAFSGRVVDANNHPLAGAVVSVNGFQNVGAKTDLYGNFKLRIQAGDTTQQMTIALNGYKQANVNLNVNALGNNIYQLQEASPSLNEVVITGYGAKRRETLAAAPLDDNTQKLDSVWLRVYPIIGKLAYQQYLDSAKQTLHLDTAIRGQERVSFQVDQKGQISEFKIEQSLSPTHDAGVIQLINGGPAWKLLRGKKARALVILNFP